MKIIPLLLVLIAAISFCALAADKPPKSKKLLHVVAFKFKPSASSAQIDHLIDEFRALKKKIPQVKSFEWGTNISPEKHDKGFTHGFLLAFASEKDRDAYLVDPAHKAFAQMAGAIIDDVFVIDYWAQE
jgi:hypothetical protein